MTNAGLANERRMASFSNYPPPESALLFVGRRTTDLIVVGEERDRRNELKGRTIVPGILLRNGTTNRLNEIALNDNFHLPSSLFILSTMT